MSGLGTYEKGLGIGVRGLVQMYRYEWPGYRYKESRYRC